MESYHELVTAIVMQAVKDWRSAVHVLKKRPRKGSAKALKAECECFFQSDWFMILTDVNGNIILQKLKQEENIDDG